ncbi:MAG: septum formation protein Maf [Cyclobacteriaceae bacterium]|nr:septum formation protein Maf [Cyclobacteriaceae bacterium]
MFPKKRYILASKSPRRQMLLTEAGMDFDVKIVNIVEEYPADLPIEKVALYLAQRKANQFPYLKEHELVITADTTVVIDDRILHKPKDETEAYEMLWKLSGREHLVITGVCLKSRDKVISFDDLTRVQFKVLSEKEISYYIQHFKPFDKAGAYGIQEWIGMIGIHSIEGSYFTVMGIPIHKVYSHLNEHFA